MDALAPPLSTTLAAPMPRTGALLGPTHLFFSFNIYFLDSLGCLPWPVLAQSHHFDGLERVGHLSERPRKSAGAAVDASAAGLFAGKAFVLTGFEPRQRPDGAKKNGRRRDSAGGDGGGGGGIGGSGSGGGSGSVSSSGSARWGLGGNDAETPSKEDLVELLERCAGFRRVAAALWAPAL